MSEVSRRLAPPAEVRGVYWAVVMLGAAATVAALAMALGRLPIDLPGPKGVAVPELYVWPATAVFAVVFFTFERQGFVFYWRDHSIKASLDELALFLGFVTLPVPNVVLGVTASVLVTEIVYRRDNVKRTFNVAQYAAAAGVAGVVVVALRLSTLPSPWAAATSPVVFSAATGFLVSLLFSRLEHESLVRIYSERFGGWSFVGASLGASLGIIVLALYRLSPPAVLVALPVLFYLRRFGHLSERADTELKAHQHLATVSTAVAGRSDMEDVAGRILAACHRLFECGEAQLAIATGGGTERTFWRETFEGGSSGVGGVTVGVEGSGGQRIGELSVFPRVGQSPFGEREHHLLRTVAASASAAAANAGALQLVQEANEELVVSERRYRGLFETSNLLIHVLDADGRIHDVNPTALAALGRSRRATVHRQITDMVPHEDHGRVTAALAALRAGRDVHGLETRFLTREGDAFEVLADAKALDTGPDGAARFVLLSRDITKLKSLEAELRLALEEKEETIHRLENANRELEEFTLWTTHDMREPLRSVGTVARLLREEIDTLAPDEARDMADRIHVGAERLKERVKALHAFSLIVQQDEAFEDVDLQGVVDAALQSLSGRIEERRATVLLPEGKLPVARAQPHRIDLVFMNLIENALKYGRPEEPTIEIGIEASEREWTFHVQDDGPGVPTEYRERVFQLFQRGPDRGEAGSGAGLAIVKRIVEQHGGRVWLEDAPSGGARFRFTLPRQRQEPWPVEAVLVEPRPPRAAARDAV